MLKNIVGYLLVALGLIVVIISLTADYSGIGNSWGLGWKQYLGTVLGIIIVYAGVWLSVRIAKREAR